MGRCVHLEKMVMFWLKVLRSRFFLASAAPLSWRILDQRLCPLWKSWPDVKERLHWLHTEGWKLRMLDVELRANIVIPCARWMSVQEATEKDLRQENRREKKNTEYYHTIQLHTGIG